MPKVTLTIDQVLTSAGIENQKGQFNILVAEFVKMNMPAEFEVQVSPDQIEADTVDTEEVVHDAQEGPSQETPEVVAS